MPLLRTTLLSAHPNAELASIDDGIMQCSRYSFGPNRLHYCGPDKAKDLYGYIKEGKGDAGLGAILKNFKTLYPYLRLIARANGIKNPLDRSVVEAYWIGNSLLNAVQKNAFYRHLLEEQGIKKRIGGAAFESIAKKIIGGAVPHHSFHVLNIWKRTGHLERAHTLESMDQCRISWGTVTAVDGPFITVETEPLLYENNTLILGTPVLKKIVRNLESYGDIADVAAGDLISMHWGIPCEVITRAQAAALRRYTLRSIAYANTPRSIHAL